MDTVNAPPSIPDMKDVRWIDLVALGTSPLSTYIKYEGITEGDMIFPNWRGCMADGTVIDYANSPVLVVETDLTPEGAMPVSVPNDLVQSLDQGWAFYSYAVSAAGSEPLGPESKRLFIYIGERHMQLPVAQIKESHGLAIDAINVAGAPATVVVVPYQAMAAGDTVKVIWQGFYDDAPEDPWSEEIQVVDNQVGQPLIFSLPRSEIIGIPGGYADLSYSIEYAVPSGTNPTTSEVQRFQITESNIPLLPPLEIAGYSEGPLDPEQYPEGIKLQVIPLYDDIQAADDVLFYWTSPDPSRSHVYWLRVDPSTQDSQVLECHVPQAVLLENVGQQVNISYQYARKRNALRNTFLSLDIIKSQPLPAPIVMGASAESDNQGFITAFNAVEGVYINVPEEVVIDGQAVNMHWQGNTHSGAVVITAPVSGNAKRFYVPKEYIAANMGGEVKRFPVFYTLKKGEEPALKSVEFALRIKALELSQYPSVQCNGLQGNKELSLASLTAQGARVYSSHWAFMAKDQLLSISVTGVTPGPLTGDVSLVLRDKGPVTQDEVTAKEVFNHVPMDFLKTLKIGEHMSVNFFVSFDGGQTTYPFQQLLDVKIVE